MFRNLYENFTELRRIRFSVRLKLHKKYFLLLYLWVCIKLNSAYIVSKNLIIFSISNVKNRIRLHSNQLSGKSFMVTSFIHNCLNGVVKLRRGVCLWPLYARSSKATKSKPDFHQNNKIQHRQNLVSSILRNVGISARFLRKLYFIGERNFGSIFL